MGANIGMTCVGLVKLGAFERAIAFEPAPDTYRLLVRNIHQNGLGYRIRHFQLALSSSEGEVELELSESNSGDHRIRWTSDPGFFREEKRRTIRVQARTLDGLVRSEPSLRKEGVGLVWMDIQGHEGHFFQGGSHFLKERRIPVVSELWPYGIERSGMSRASFCLILQQLFTGFYVFDCEPFQRHPISEIGALCDLYSKPREMCLIMLVPDRPQRVATPAGADL